MLARLPEGKPSSYWGSLIISWNPPYVNDGDLSATLPGNSVFTAGTGGRRNQEASIQPQTEIQTLGMRRGGWLRNPINHRKDDWNPRNNGICTTYQLVQIDTWNMDVKFPWNMDILCDPW